MAGIVNAKNHSVGPGRAASGLYRYPSSVWHCVPGIDDQIEDDIVEFALNTVDRLQTRTNGDYQFVGWAADRKQIRCGGGDRAPDRQREELFVCAL